MLIRLEEMKRVTNSRILILIYSLMNVIATSNQVRICITQDVLLECQKMSTDVSRRLSLTIDCVTGRDRMDCMRMVSGGEADTVNVGPEDAYVGDKLFDLQPLLFEEINSALYRYRAAAIVRTDLDITTLSDLRGKNSCHTGYKKTSGWNVPVALMIADGIIQTNCSGDELASVANFFSASCVPGKWAHTNETDSKLKAHNPNLCELCQSKCSGDEDELYSGYEGAIRCLVDGRGDVAFTSVEAASKYLKSLNPVEQDKYRFLCLNGTKNKIYQPCPWAKRPSNVFLTSKKTEQDLLAKYRNSLRSAFSRVASEKPSWMTLSFVSSDKVTKLLPPNPDMETISQYLSPEYMTSIEKPSPGCQMKSVKFCVSSKVEMMKCEDLKAVAFAHRIRPSIDCFFADKHANCLSAVQTNIADVITLDAADVYIAGKYHEMTPILAEKYGDLNTSYYAVAVVDRDSGIESIQDLKGKKSCHAGIGNAAGWDIPVSVLIEENLIQPEKCDYANAVAEFFSGGSCVPGAKSSKYDNSGSNSETLCSLCVGDDGNQHNCSKSFSERMSGYGGAFRCLASGIGDVAFVKQDTVTSLTDRKSDAKWAKSLRSADYVILCRDGGTRNVDEYENCHLAKVPGSAVMTSTDKSSIEKEALSNLLMDIAKKFGPDSETFTLFASYHGTSDLLFADSTTALVSLPEEANYMEFLGDYLETAESVDPNKCSEESSAEHVLPQLFVTLTFCGILMVSL